MTPNIRDTNYYLQLYNNPISIQKADFRALTKPEICLVQSY